MVARRSRLRAIAVRTVQVVLGLVLGLACAEWIFRARDHGAFPHLNCYVADSSLGVRLRPGARQRVQFGGNAPSDVRINAQGYRGPDFPAPSADEVLVVGDSQVFGLGVEEHEAFVAKLGPALGGKQVIGAGVPTYGPLEYLAVMEELLATRHSKTVVLVINFANDLFEMRRPNKDRHVVWDGWAVRAETAPAHVGSFPLRTFLFRESHAFFALRTWWHRRGHALPEVDERGFGSEGTYRDLVALAAAADASHHDAELDTAKIAKLWQEEIRKTGNDALLAQKHLVDLAVKTYPDYFAYQLAPIVYKEQGGTPGDIVFYQQSEAGPGPGENAGQLYKGAEIRLQVETELQRLAKLQADQEKGKAVLDSFEQRAALQKKLAELQAAPLAIVRAWSPMRPMLERAKAICDAHGARLVVVALPLDVQVSSDEFAKYGATPIDMKGTRRLVDDLVESAEAMGVSALDATPALSKAEPGAFLLGDIHLTPKGHSALADAIAVRLAAPDPGRMPEAVGLPLGRSRVPSREELGLDAKAMPQAKVPASRVLGLDEWRKEGTVDVRGALAPGCELRRVREWIRIACAGDGPTAPIGAAVESGGRSEALITRFGSMAAVLAPVLAGDSLAVVVSFAKNRQRIVVSRSSNGDWLVDAAVPKLDAAVALTTEGAERLCACHAEQTGDASCAAVIGAPDRDCARTYDDCARLVACSAASPESPPRCLPGWLHAGSTGHCFESCSGSACSTGTCQDWQGLRICM
jgi:hypothetical protein